MNVNATNRATHFKLEIGREDSEQSQAIPRHIDLEIDSSQATILQPVNGNGAGQKAKSKTKTRHGGKEQPSTFSLTSVGTPPPPPPPPPVDRFFFYWIRPSHLFLAYEQWLNTVFLLMYRHLVIGSKIRVKRCSPSNLTQMINFPHIISALRE